MRLKCAMWYMWYMSNGQRQICGDSSLEVPRGWDRGEERVLFNDYRVCLGHEKVLQIHSSYGWGNS